MKKTVTTDLSENIELYIDVFPKRLRMLRKQRGFTQKQLARMLNVTNIYISYLENGHRKPSPESLIRLSIILKAPVGYFLGTESSSIQRK